MCQEFQPISNSVNPNALKSPVQLPSADEADSPTLQEGQLSGTLVMPPPPPSFQHPAATKDTHGNTHRARDVAAATSDALEDSSIPPMLQELNTMVAAVTAGNISLPTPWDKQLSEAPTSMTEEVSLFEDTDFQSMECAIPDPLGGLASGLMRSMSTYNGAALAHIAQGYRTMGFFDSAVFERIAFEIDCRGDALALKPAHIATTLHALADLRADQHLDAVTIHKVLKPLYTAASQMIEKRRASGSPTDLPTFEAASIARSFAVLSRACAARSEACPAVASIAADTATWSAKFVTEAMANCRNNPSPTPGSLVWHALMLLNDRNLDHLMRPAFRAAQRTSVSDTEPLSEEGTTVLDILKDILHGDDYDLTVLQPSGVGGIPVSAILSITDRLNGRENYTLMALRIASAHPRLVTGVTGEKYQSGEGFVREEIFKNWSNVTNVPAETQLSKPSIIVTLSSPFVASLATRAKFLDPNGAFEQACEILQAALESTPGNLTFSL